MTKNGHTRGSDEPKNSSEGGGKKSDRDSNTQQTSVELRGSSLEGADLQISSLEFADEPHAERNKDDVEQEPHIGDKAVDAEHHDDHGIVAGEVAEIVVDACLHFGEVVGLGQPLQIEELGDWLEVGEALAQGLAAQAREPIAKVEARRQNVNRDVDSGHGW